VEKNKDFGRWKKKMSGLLLTTVIYFISPLISSAGVGGKEISEKF
jgi:hypothetical protein